MTVQFVVGEKTPGSIRTVELHPTAIEAIKSLKSTNYVDKKEFLLTLRP